MCIARRGERAAEGPTMSATISALTETCPACGGAAQQPAYFCSRGRRGGCQVKMLACPFCAGSGEVRRGRGAWAEIGARLRENRLRQLVGVVEQDGRRYLTVDPDIELEPMPLDLQAKLYDVPPTLLDAIENGLADPRIVAKKVHPAWA